MGSQEVNSTPFIRFSLRLIKDGITKALPFQVTLSGVEGSLEQTTSILKIMGLYVYILKCVDESFYVGVTNNPERRILEHNHGIYITAYTYSRRPVVIAWQTYFISNKEAIQWEKKLKGWTKRKKQALIENKFKLLHEFSKCGNESSHVNFGESCFDSAQHDSSVKSIQYNKLIPSAQHQNGFDPENDKGFNSTPFQKII